MALIFVFYHYHCIVPLPLPIVRQLPRRLRERERPRAARLLVPLPPVRRPEVGRAPTRPELRPELRLRGRELVPEPRRAVKRERR